MTIRTLSCTALLLFSVAAQADRLREQHPLTVGAGLSHPVPLNALRGGVILASGDLDLTALQVQGEQYLSPLQNQALPLHLGAIGSLTFAEIDAGPSDVSLTSVEGGLRLSAAVPDIPGLWTAFSLLGSYSRAEDESETDIHGTLSARYQFTGSARPWALYGAASLGNDVALSDHGLLLGAATSGRRGTIWGAEIATEADSLTGYANLALNAQTMLAISVGVADDIDLIAQLQLTHYLK